MSRIVFYKGMTTLVTGAGMAGMVGARELKRAGISVRVLEARDRVGGLVHSVRDFCGSPVEAGAEFIHGVNAATWSDVREASFAVRPCPLMRHTMFNLGGGTSWLPFLLMHPATWPVFRSCGGSGAPDRRIFRPGNL